jgi:excisionase family DNA binding protein
MPKPSKTPAIEAFVNANVGKTFTTKEMCEQIGCSLPTLLSYLKNNVMKFTMVSYGSYLINSDVTSTTTLNSADSITDEEWENN